MPNLLAVNYGADVDGWAVDLNRVARHIAMLSSKKAEQVLWFDCYDHFSDTGTCDCLAGVTRDPMRQLAVDLAHMTERDREVVRADVRRIRILTTQKRTR